jgi:hypothetical protein
MSTAQAVETNKATARRLVYDLFTDGDLRVLDEAIAEDYLNHNAPPACRPAGRVSARSS